jgi:hypothetical protein
MPRLSGQIAALAIGLRDLAVARLRDAIAEMRREPRPDSRKSRSLGYIH